MTPKARAFTSANDASPVVEGAANTSGGGGSYGLANGKRYALSLEDMRSLPKGYPRWDFPAAVPVPKRGPKSPLYASKKVDARHAAACTVCTAGTMAGNALAWAHHHTRRTGHTVNLKLQWTIVCDRA